MSGAERRKDDARGERCARKGAAEILGTVARRLRRAGLFTAAEAYLRNLVRQAEERYIEVPGGSLRTLATSRTSTEAALKGSGLQALIGEVELDLASVHVGPEAQDAAMEKFEKRSGLVG
jgi:hypothetical protein